MTDPAARLEAILTRLEALADRPPAPVPRFFTVNQAASHAALCPESIRRLIARGDIRALRPLPGKILIDRLALDQFVLGATHQPTLGRGRRRRRGAMK